MAIIVQPDINSPPSVFAGALVVGSVGAAMLLPGGILFSAPKTTSLYPEPKTRGSSI